MINFVRHRVFQAAFALSLLIGLFVSMVNAQTSSDYHPFLITFGNQANTYEGDHDHRQVVRFSVPGDIEGKLYVRVFDADTAGKYDESPDWYNTAISYSLYGKDGSATISRDEVGTLVENTSGSALGSVEIGRDAELDGKWTTLFSFDAGEGKVNGNAREFFMLVAGVAGNDGNVFDVRISNSDDENTTPEGIRLYSYLPTVRMAEHDFVTQLTFDVPKDEGHLTIENFDTARGIVAFDGRFRSVPLTASGQDEWASDKIVLNSHETGELASITLGGGEENPNDASLYIADATDNPVAINLPPETFRVNQRPTLEMSQTPLACNVMRFDAANSVDLDEEALTYRWLFEDGSVETNPVVTREYSKTGSYSARLEITDQSKQVGNGVAKNFDVFIKDRPVQSFEAPELVAQGSKFDLKAITSLQWLAASNEVQIKTIEWNMGNGQQITALGKTTATYSYPDHGDYQITMKATDDSDNPCNTKTLTRTISVNAQPVADAGGDRRVGHGDLIEFSGAGSSDANGDDLSYVWDLGDGTVINEKSFSHKYENPGTYKVTLKVNDGREISNNEDTNVVSVFVNAPPVAQMNVPAEMTTGQLALFSAKGTNNTDGKFTTIKWLLPEGISNSRDSFNHAFFAPGKYEVTLVVTDDSGLDNDTTTITRTINVSDLENKAPVADAGGNREAIVDDTLTFDASNSKDDDGSILSYQWDFGDGLTASGLKVDHVYRQTGEFVGTLTITDDSEKPNAVASDQFTVTIAQKSNVSAAINAGGDRTAKVNELLTFDATSTLDEDGNPISYNWDFGDGTKGSGIAVHHTYTKPGTYNVGVSVVDDSALANKQSQTEFKVVVAHAANSTPVFDLQLDMKAVTRQVLTFDGSKAVDDNGQITAYKWDFGDGHKSDLAIVKHAYAKPGKYSGTFVAVDNSGLDSGILEKKFEVVITPQANLPPTAKISAKTTALVNETVSLNGSKSSDEDGSVVGYEWDFGNGKKVIGENASIAYFKPGRYPVKLTVTDNSGHANATAVDEIEIVISDRSNISPVAAVKENRPAAIDEVIDFSGAKSVDNDGNIISYKWDFGDGSLGQGRETAHAYQRSGVYVASLRIKDDSGLANDESETIRIIRVNEPPVANAGPDQHVTASVVHFDAGASGDQDGAIIRYSWDFGDGNKADGKTISHIYREPGTYDVNLEIEDDSGAIRNLDDDQMQVTVNALPVADAGPDFVVTPGESIEFDGGRSSDPDGKVASYFWDFKDGNKGEGERVTHKYEKPGTYFVSLKVADDSLHENAFDFSGTQVVVNAKPIAVAGSDMVVAPGQELLLSGSDSYDSDGEITEWRWNFSDKLFSADTVETSRAFEEPGIYKAILTVSDGSIASNSTSQDTLEIFVNHAPVAEAGKNIFKDELRVVLDGSASTDADNDGLTYHWDLGDGNTASGPKVVHVYQTGGVFPVILSVDDGRGLANSRHRDSTSVTINRPPVAVAGADKRVCVGDVVVFDGSGSSDPDGGPIRYTWDFGDAEPSSLVNPTKVYKTPGTYQIQLKTNDASGLENNWHRDSLLISVDAAPVANAGEDILACANTEVQFDGSKSTDIDGVVNRFSWDFGDTTRGGGERPKHLYTVAGDYKVLLSIAGEGNNSCSATSRDEVRVKIVNAPQGVITATESAAVGTAVEFDGSLSTITGGNISEYEWDFGDGKTQTGVNVSHIFEKPGEYRVALTIRAPELAAKCQTNKVWHTIKVNATPVADAGEDREVTVNRILVLTGAASSDADGGLTFYQWDLGDGNVANGLDVRHAWKKPGTYKVKLTVTDDTELSNKNGVDEITVTVKPAAETTIKTAETACVGEPMNFELANLSKEADKATLLWNFGDGNTQKAAVASNVYKKPGTYSISVGGSIVGPLATNQMYVSKSLKVNHPPVVIPGSYRKTCPGTNVVFDASRSLDFDGKISEFAWNFGDGQSEKGEKVTHAFEKPGTYEVSLKVTDDSGSSCASKTQTFNVFVNSTPKADAGPDIVAKVGGARDRVSFDASRSVDADGDALIYYWELSSGEEFDGERPGHLFSKPGNLQMTLTAADVHDLPCSYSTDTVDIKIESR